MERYRLAELATLTGLTPRTIRFYIQEGLLPPPEGAGRAAAYTAEHRDRLALIERLKARYLPLREIRRHLAALDAEEVRERLRGAGAGSTPGPPATFAIAEDSAADYLDRVLGPAAAPPGSPPVETVVAPAPAPPASARLAARPPGPPARRARWERVALGEGVELHVREDRLREVGPLEALIRQARKLLGEE